MKTFGKLISLLVIVGLAACGGADTPAPAAPSGVTASALADAVEVKWKDNSQDETGFVIYREDAAGAVAALRAQAEKTKREVPADTTSYKDTSVEAGKTYTYSVSVKKGGTESKAVKQTGAAVGPSAVPPAPPATPPAPPAAPPPSRVSGTFETWDAANGSHLHFVMEGTQGAVAFSAAVDAEGTFAVEPSALPEEALSEQFLCEPDTFTGQRVFGGYTSATAEPTDDGRIGDFLFSTNPALLDPEDPSQLAVGDAIAIWLYSDKAASLTGSCTEPGAEGSYDLELKAGWNATTLEVTAISETGITFRQTTGLPATGEWLFVPYEAAPLALSGVIPDWDATKGPYVRFSLEGRPGQVAASGLVDDAGQFTAELPALSPDNVEERSACSGDDTFQGGVFFWGSTSASETSDALNTTGQLYYGTNPALVDLDDALGSIKAGDTLAVWMYSAEDTSLIGSCDEGPFKGSYDLQLKAGWNETHLLVTTADEKSATLEQKTGLPANGGWALYTGE